MINEAKDGMKNTLHTNEAIRKEERVFAEEDTNTLSFDENYDSETRDTSYEPATPSSKASTLPAKHNIDNEETSLKKTNPGPWTSKQECLEKIRKLYFKCGGDANYEHLYVKPSKWMDLLKYEKKG